MNQPADRQALFREYLNRLRQSLFDREEPPFLGALTAAQWLRAEHQRGAGSDYIDKLSRLDVFQDTLFQQLKARVHDFPPGWTIQVGAEAELVFFRDERGRGAAVVATTEALARLCRAARTLAALTQRSELDATMMLLTGTPAPRPVPRRRLKDLAFIMLFEELRKRGMRPPRSTGRRGVRVGIRAYWQKFIETWNDDTERTTRFGPYKNWTSAQKAYQRLRLSEKEEWNA